MKVMTKKRVVYLLGVVLFVVSVVMCLVLYSKYRSAGDDTASRGNIDSKSQRQENLTDDALVHKPPLRLVDMIVKMPPWFAVQHPSDVECQKIEQTLLSIDEYKTHEIRRAIEYCLNRSANDSNELDMLGSKVFLIIKYVFDVPDSDLEFSVIVDGWLRKQDSQNASSRLWPLKLNRDGSPRVIDIFHGRSGPKYKPLNDFDSHERLFGRRKYQELQL